MAEPQLPPWAMVMSRCVLKKPVPLRSPSALQFFEILYIFKKNYINTTSGCNPHMYTLPIQPRFYPYPWPPGLLTTDFSSEGLCSPWPSCFCLTRSPPGSDFLSKHTLSPPAINHAWQSLAHEIGQCCSCPVTPSPDPSNLCSWFSMSLDGYPTLCFPWTHWSFSRSGPH